MSDATGETGTRVVAEAAATTTARERDSVPALSAVVQRSLREIMRQADLNQFRIAKVLGVTNPRVHAILNQKGRDGLTLRTVEEFAEACGAVARVVFEWKPGREPASERVPPSARANASAADDGTTAGRLYARLLHVQVDLQEAGDEEGEEMLCDILDGWRARINTNNIQETP